MLVIKSHKEKEGDKCIGSLKYSMSFEGHAFKVHVCILAGQQCELLACSSIKGQWLCKKPVCTLSVPAQPATSLVQTDVESIDG